MQEIELFLFTPIKYLNNKIIKTKTPFLKLTSAIKLFGEMRLICRTQTIYCILHSYLAYWQYPKIALHSIMVCRFILRRNGLVYFPGKNILDWKALSFNYIPVFFKWEDAHQIQDAWMFMSLEWHDGKALFLCNIATRPNLFPRQAFGFVFYLHFDMLLFMRRAKEISH